MIKLTQIKEHPGQYEGVRHHFIPVEKIRTKVTPELIHSLRPACHEIYLPNGTVI